MICPPSAARAKSGHGWLVPRINKHFGKIWTLSIVSPPITVLQTNRALSPFVIFLCSFVSTTAQRLFFSCLWGEKKNRFFFFSVFFHQLTDPKCVKLLITGVLLVDENIGKHVIKSKMSRLNYKLLLGGGWGIAGSNRESGMKHNK